MHPFPPTVVRATLATVALALLAAAGCTDDSAVSVVTDSRPTDTGAPPTSEGACGLITTAELTAIVGKPLADGESGTEGAADTCRWEATEPSANPDIDEPFFVLLAILPLTATDQATLEELAADTEHNLVLEGLGDSALVQCAFSSTDGCPWRDKVFVTKGDQYLMVDVGNFSTPDDFDDGEIEQIVIAVAETAAPAF